MVIVLAISASANAQPEVVIDDCNPIGLVCEPSVCLESGAVDVDCCAIVGQASCSAGYTFSYNQHQSECPLNTGTCCTPNDAIKNTSDYLPEKCWNLDYAEPVVAPTPVVSEEPVVLEPEPEPTAG